MTELQTTPGSSLDGGFSPAFLEACQAALRVLFQDPAHSGTRNQLREVFEYRSQFDWLGESGRRPGMSGSHSGLAYAIAYALATYRIGDPAEVKADCGADTSGAPYSPDQWTSDLLAATELLSDHQLSVERFGRNLLRAEVDLEKSPTSTLRVFACNAIAVYCEQGRRHLGSDPW